MRLRWIVIALCLVVLIASTDAQKRRKGDRKKETDAQKVDGAPKKADEKIQGRHRGRHATTTSTTTTTTTTEAPIIEEEVDQELVITNESRSSINECPPELKEQDGKTLPCTCRDKLDDDALMVECVALTSAEEMHDIFNVLPPL